jgi:hypothetical protein
MSDTKNRVRLRLLTVASPLIGGLPVPKGADMKDTQIHAQYATGLSRRNIEQALVAAGKDLNHLQPADLGLLEDFHAMGRMHAFLPDFAEKAQNLTVALTDGRLRAIQAVAHAITH